MKEYNPSKGGETLPFGKRNGGMLFRQGYYRNAQNEKGEQEEKNVSTKLCALLVCVMTFCTGMAVPAAVEEHGGSIIKTYELAPEESPQLLIEEPFERDGFLYEYGGMTQEPVSKTESKSVSQTVTVESGSAKTEENLALLHPLRGGRIHGNADTPPRLHPYGDKGLCDPILHSIRYPYLRRSRLQRSVTHPTGRGEKRSDACADRHHLAR